MLSAGVLESWKHRGCLDQFGPSSDLISSTLRVENQSLATGKLFARFDCPCIRPLQRDEKKMDKAVTINLMRQITLIAGRCHEFITNLSRIYHELLNDRAMAFSGG